MVVIVDGSTISLPLSFMVVFSVVAPSLIEKRKRSIFLTSITFRNVCNIAGEDVEKLGN